MKLGEIKHFMNIIKSKLKKFAIRNKINVPTEQTFPMQCCWRMKIGGNERKANICSVEKYTKKTS